MQLTINKYYKHVLWQPLAHPSVDTTIKAIWQISKWLNTLQSNRSFGYKLTACYFELSTWYKGTIPARLAVM